MFIHGNLVHSSPFCVKVEVTWRVERHATKKRRRNWRVVRHQRDVPCAYRMADGRLVMHPDLYRQLFAATQAERKEK